MEGKIIAMKFLWGQKCDERAENVEEIRGKVGGGALKSGGANAPPPLPTPMLSIKMKIQLKHLGD